MGITDLAKIKRDLLDTILHEDKKPQDEFRQGVGTGLTLALMRIERMIEEEERAQARYYEQD